MFQDVVSCPRLGLSRTALRPRFSSALQLRLRILSRVSLEGSTLALSMLSQKGYPNLFHLFRHFMCSETHLQALASNSLPPLCPVLCQYIPTFFYFPQYPSNLLSRISSVTVAYSHSFIFGSSCSTPYFHTSTPEAIRYMQIVSYRKSSRRIFFRPFLRSRRELGLVVLEFRCDIGHKRIIWRRVVELVVYRGQDFVD